MVKDNEIKGVVTDQDETIEADYVLLAVGREGSQWLTNLFEKLGVKIPIINNINDLKENVTQYDIQKVNTEINNIRKFAISKIKDAMQKKVTNINYMNELNVIFYNINFKNIMQNIFSVNNEYSNNKKRKVITILFLKIKFKIKSN